MEFEPITSATSSSSQRFYDCRSVLFCVARFHSLPLGDSQVVLCSSLCSAVNANGNLHCFAFITRHLGSEMFSRSWASAAKIPSTSRRSYLCNRMDYKHSSFAKHKQTRKRSTVGLELETSWSGVGRSNHCASFAQARRQKQDRERGREIEASRSRGLEGERVRGAGLEVERVRWAEGLIKSCRDVRKS